VYGILNSIYAKSTPKPEIWTKKTNKNLIKSLIHFFGGSDRRRHRGMFFPGVWDMCKLPLAYTVLAAPVWINRGWIRGINALL